MAVAGKSTPQFEYINVLQRKKGLMKKQTFIPV